MQKTMPPRAAMMSFKADKGRILGVTPTARVVPPSLESPHLAEHQNQRRRRVKPIEKHRRSPCHPVFGLTAMDGFLTATDASIGPPFRMDHPQVVLQTFAPSRGLPASRC